MTYSVFPIQRVSSHRTFRAIIYTGVVFNALIICDPSDNNYGFGFSVSYVPYALILLGLFVFYSRKNLSIFDAKFSISDVFIALFLVVPLLGSFVYSRQNPDEHFLRFAALGLVYFLAKQAFKIQHLV